MQHESRSRSNYFLKFTICTIFQLTNIFETELKTQFLLFFLDFTSSFEFLFFQFPMLVCFCFVCVALFLRSIDKTNEKKNGCRSFISFNSSLTLTSLTHSSFLPPSLPLCSPVRVVARSANKIASVLVFDL